MKPSLRSALAAAIRAAPAALSAAGPINRATVVAIERASRWACACSTSGAVLPADIEDRRLAAATANIGVQTAQLYPDVAIGAQLGSVGAARDAYTSPTNFWGVGAVLKWQADQSAARAHPRRESLGQAGFGKF
jgi:hypothetical protein